MPLPGFCGPATLFTDGQLQITGTTSATGSMSSGTQGVRWNNFFAGITLYTQAAVIDAGLPAGIGLSNGRQATILAMPPLGQWARIYASGNPTATTGSVGLGYALVTEFRL